MRIFGRHFSRAALPAVLAALILSSTAWAQRGRGPLDPAEPKGITVQEIIQRFVQAEGEFQKAHEQYTWRRTVKVEEPESGGRYELVVDLLFDSKGRRIENVVYAPQPTLQRISMSPQDYEDLENRIPFALTPDRINEYDIRYAGQQRVDELETYVFEVGPKEMEKGKRYFQGRIWVDTIDFQIVMTEGRNVPDYHGKNENLFPEFTTWRQQVDGKYWFPVYSRADDVLHFSTGDVPIKMIVKYEDYKRFGTDVKVTYEGQEVEREPSAQGNPEQQPQQKPQ